MEFSYLSLKRNFMLVFILELFSRYYTSELTSNNYITSYIIQYRRNRITTGRLKINFKIFW